MAQPDIAVDGQRLSDAANAGAVGAFYTAYGNDAPWRWAAEHNRAIGFGGDPLSQWNTNGGVKTITQIGNELAAAGYPGPDWSEGAMVAAYGRASGTVPTPHSSAPPPNPSPTPPNPANVPAITPTLPATAKVGDACTLPDGTVGVVTKNMQGGMVCAVRPGADTGGNIAAGLGQFGQAISQPITAFGLTLPTYAWLGAAAGTVMVLSSIEGPRRRR
jgi:hypothetical protein